MRLAVLCTPGSWYLRDLVRAAGARHEIVPVSFRDVHAALALPVPLPEGERTEHNAFAVAAGEVNLAACDAVLVRTMPPGSLEQVVFRMDALARLEAAGRTVINPAKAIEAAVDKFLASAKLHAAGLRVPRTVVCQSADDALAAFAALGGDVVVKPLFGAEGRGIARIQDAAIAQRTFALLAQLGAVIYLQQFVPHEGCDLRVLVIGDEAWGMRRRNPLDWRTNVSRGARAELLPLSAELVELARRAAAAVGAPVAGVDLLPGRDGQLYAIEVNAVPGWQALARVTGVDIAERVVAFAVRTARGVA